MWLPCRCPERCSLLPKRNHGDSTQDLIIVKERLSLTNGVTLIIGCIIGTGIFVTPKGVLMATGSLGMALVVWCVCGILSMMGALCYIELGTTFPKSGGDFTYIQNCLGELPAFLCIWMNLVILGPVGKAISAITFANYVLQPFFPYCSVPQDAVRMIAASILCLITYINCRNVELTARMQDIFTLAKVTALILIISAGIYQMSTGNTQNFDNAFEGTTAEPGYLVLSFYSGLFTYSGWGILNCVMEEVKEPLKNLPRAIYISLPLVTIIYVLTNVAYFAVLTQEELLSSNAVAVTFGDHILGVMSWIMPFSVALSTFGGLNGGIFASARQMLVGAREGHLPNLLSMINVHCFTPAPSLVLLCMMSLVYLCTTEIYVLINYATFSEAFFVTLSVSGMLWLRYKQPELHRPIKMNIFLILAYLVICVILVTLPFYVRPLETGLGLAIILTGIPVYMVTIYWSDKPESYKKVTGKVTSFIQKLLLSVPEEKSKSNVANEKNKSHLPEAISDGPESKNDTNVPKENDSSDVTKEKTK